VITFATLAVSPNRGGAVWITGPVGRANLTHTDAVVIQDVDEEYDLVQETIADRYLYAPTPEAAHYARSLGVRPASIRNLSEPARALQEAVWHSHRNQVCSDPSVLHPEPLMRPVPGPIVAPPDNQLALATAPVAANYLLAVWQAWLDAECERACRDRGLGPTAERIIRILPDEFVIAEHLVSC
jgi:hypothetical protein